MTAPMTQAQKDQVLKALEAACQLEGSWRLAPQFWEAILALTGDPRRLEALTQDLSNELLLISRENEHLIRKPRKVLTTKQRIKRLTFKQGDCRLPKSPILDGVYGCLDVGDKKLTLARAVWLDAGREIQPGMVLTATCEHRACCALKHLVAASRSEVMRRAYREGRHSKPVMKLEADQVRAIRRRADAGELHRVIAADYGISRAHVTNLARRDPKIGWMGIEP